MPRKAATKATPTPTPANPLAGQKVALVGKFGYKDWWRKDLIGWAKAAKLTVADPKGNFDILVVDRGRFRSCPLRRFGRSGVGVGFLGISRHR